MGMAFVTAVAVGPWLSALDVGKWKGPSRMRSDEYVAIQVEGLSKQYKIGVAKHRHDTVAGSSDGWLTLTTSG